MVRIFFVLVCFIFSISSLKADELDFSRYFDVDMQIDLSDIKDYIPKLNNEINNVYNKGYISRFNMGKQFKKEFSQTIKKYGSSEGRIKSQYEDDLLELLRILPKEAYQYIGPVLHEVPGMSEKILNLPGIKETKNKFPEDIADKYKVMDNIEFLSPSFYFLLMPSIWDKRQTDLDEPETIPVKKPRVQLEIPNFLKEKIGIPVKKNNEPRAAQHKPEKVADRLNQRTIFPTLVSPLTGKDIEAFLNTLDEIEEWGTANNMQNMVRLLRGERFLDMWEKEKGIALEQNALKDMVNPCQRLVLKTKFAGLYTEFSSLISAQGFRPEEWAYTCDKTLKAFRATNMNSSMAYAVQMYRRGLYRPYYDMMPRKWRENLYVMEAAIVKMYTSLKEDVETVRPFREEINKILNKNNGMILTSPIVY